MTLLAKAGVELDLNSTDISIESILGIIFSIDLDKLIKEFTIADKEIKLSLNVSDFISELNELDIMIKDETEGLSLSLSLFDVLLKVKPVEEVNVEVSNDYNNISFASFILDDALLIVKNKKAEAIATIKVFNLDVNAHLYVDFNESLKLNAVIALTNGVDSKEVEVTFLNNTIYLTIDNIGVKIAVEELISLLNEFGLDTESVMSKLNSNDLSLEDIIAVIFSLDFKKIVKSFNINENNINLSLDLSDFIEALNDLVILVENTEHGFDLSVNFYEINAQVLCDTDFNIEVEENKFQNLTFVKFLIDDVMLILDSKEVEANVSLVYESLNIHAKALVDFNDSLKVKANVTLSNGVNSKDIEVLFIDNTIYLSVDSINVKITLETLFGLLTQAGVDTSSITNLSVGEMSVEEIINTVLSIDLAQIIKVFKLEESKITLSADLSSFVDFLSEINLILTDEGNNVVGLSLDMFDINGTIKSVSNEAIEVEKEYKELANLSFIIDDVFEIIDNKAVELNVSLKYEDFIINGEIVVDFNDSIRVKGHVALNYKEYTKELDLVFVNNTIYVSIDSINLSITLEDLVEILSYAEIDITPVLGVISGESSMNVNEIIDMVLSINFSDIVKALEIEDKYLSVGLDLSKFIDSIGELNVIIEEAREGLKLSVDMFDITATVKSISNSEINSFEAVNLGEAKDIVRNVIEIVNSKKLALDASLKYESLDITLNGELDFTDSIKAKVNAIISNSEYQKSLNLVFVDNTIYVSLDNLNLMISVDELMDILNTFDVSLGSSEFSLDTILGIVLSKNLNEIITTLEFVDSKLNVGVDLSSLVDFLGIINATIGTENGIDVSLDMFDAQVNVLSIDETNIEPVDSYERVYNAKFVIEFVKAVLDKKALNINLSLKYESLVVSGDATIDFNENIKVKANLVLSNGTDSIEIEVLFIDNTIYLSVDSINLKITLETLFEILAKAGVDTSSFEGILSGDATSIDVNEIVGLVLSINLNDIIKVLRLEESKITLSADLSMFLSILDDIELIISDLDNKVGLTLNMFDIDVVAEVIDNSNIQVEKEYKELANLSFIIDDVFEIIDNKAVELNVSLKYEDFIINGEIVVDFNDSIRVKGHVALNYKEYTKELDLVFVNNTIYVSIDSINLSITLEDLVEILSYAEIDITPVLGVISGESSMNVNEIIDMVLSINFSDIVKALEIEDKYLSVGLDLSKFIDSIGELNVIIEEAREGLKLSVDMFDITATVKSISNSEINSFEAVNLGEAKDIVRNVIEIVNSKKLALDASLKYESLDITLNGELDFTDSIKAKVNAIISNSEYQKSLNLVFVDNTIYVSLDNLNLMISVDELMEILGLFDITLDSNEFNLDSILGIILSKNLSEIITTLEFIDSKLNLSVNLKDFIEILDEINAVIYASEGVNVSLDMFDIVVNARAISETNIEPVGSYERVYNAKFVVEFVKAVLDNKAISANLSLKYETLTVTGNVVLDFNDSINAKINATLSNGTDSKDIEILFIDNAIYLSVDSINVKISLETLFTILTKAGVDVSKVEGFLNGSELSIDINEVIGLVLSLNFNDIIKVLRLEEDRITLSADLSRFLDALNDISLIITDLDGKVGLSLNMFDVEATVEVINDANIQVEKEYKELANLTFIADNVFEIIDTKAIETLISLKYENLLVNANVVADFNSELKVKVDAHLTYKDMYKDAVIVFVNNTIYVSIDSINLSITLEDLFEILSYASVDMSKVEDLMSGDSELNVLDIIDTVLSINFSDIVKALEIEDKYLSVNLDLSRFIESITDLSVIVEEATEGIKLSANMFDINGTIKSISNPEINTFDATDLGESKEIVRNVIELINNKKISINGTLKYESLNIALDGKVDFTDSIVAKVNVLLSNSKNSKEISVVYAENVLYLSIDTINLKITLEELMDILKVFDIDLESDEDTLDKVLDKVFDIDFNEVIKTLEFVDSKLNLDVDLSSLIDILGEINAIISVEDGISVSLDMLDTSINVSKADTVEYTLKDSYERVYNAKFIVELVKDILDKKALSLTLSLSKDDLSIAGDAVLDFSESLKVKATLALNYKQIEVPVSILFLMEEGNLENVIYIDLYNVHATITLAELLEALNLENKELKIDDIIDLVLSLNFDELLNNVSIEEGLISLLLDLRSLDIELLDKIIDTDVIQDLSITRESNNLRVYSSSLFSLNIEVSVVDSLTIEKENNNYINLSSLLTEVMDKIDELKDSSFEADITGNINLGDVLIVNLDATLNAKVKVVKDGDNYQISIVGHIETADFIIDLKVVIDDGYLYLTLGGFNAKLKLEGIMDFIEEVIAIFKEEGEQGEGLDLSSVNKLLKTLRLDSAHEVNADLSSLISKFTTAYVLVDLNGESIIKVNDDKNNEFASLKVTLNVNNDLEKVELPTEVVTEDDILSLLEDINDIIKLVKSKNFLIKIASSTSPIEFYKDSELKFKIYGTLNVVPYGEDHYNYKVEVNLIEYKNNKKINDHYIGLVYYEEMFYLTYRNSSNESNAINATSTKEDVYGLIAALEEALDLDLSMLDDILVDFTPYLDENLKHVDFTQLRGLIKNLTNSGDSSTNKDKINISKVLYEFKILSGWCSTRLDNHEISKELPAKNYSTISFRRDDSREFNDAYIDSFYLKYEDGVYTGIKNISLEFERGIEVKKPNFSNPYDFSHLGDLLKGVLVAAAYHDFSIKGTVKLKALAVVTMDVPIQAYVHNDEEGKPVVFVHIDMNDVPLLARVLVSQKDIYIVYKDGYMYIDRVEGSKHTKIKVTTETFFGDIVYYLLDFSMGLPSSITSAITDTNNEDHVVDASKALTKFTYSVSSGNPKYSIGLDLGEITGSSDLGVLSLSINLAKFIAEQVGLDIYEVYTVKSITDLSLGIASVLDITCSSLSLSNVSYQNGFEEVIINNMALRDYILSYVSQYFTLNGTEYDPDKIYENNKYKSTVSHHVYFIQGSGTTLSGDPLEIITVDCASGSTFSLKNPTSEYIMINGREYYFGGWYTSRDYKTPFTSDMCTMGDRNISIYALWIPMYEYRVEDVNGSGYSKFYKLGESTATYTVNTSHGEFLGFYDRVTGNLVDLSTTLPSRTVEGDIYIYAKWDKMYYLVLDDETNLILSSSSTNTDQINGLENDKYQIYKDGIYYTYLKEDITSFMLHTNYESLFEKHVEQDFTYYTFNIYTYNSVREGYREYTFQFNTELYKDNNGLTPYVSVMILKTSTFTVSLFPYAKYSIYETNAWVNTSNVYYSKDVNATVEGTRFSAYYSVLPSYFTRSNSKITGFASGKSAETLILPYYINGTVMTTVGQAAFSGNSSIKHIYIADSYTTLEQDAFKNTENLEDVYISASVRTIAKDAFYYDYIDRSDVQTAHGRYVKLYFLYDDLRDAYNFNSNKLLAYKYTDITHWSKTDRYYGEKNTQTPETVKTYIITKVMEIFN